MFDFLLDPAVTITVIACLNLVIVLQYLDGKRRMRDLTKRLGRMAGALLAAAVSSARIVEQAKVMRAIQLTFELKEMNLDLTLDDLLFGKVPTWNEIRAATGRPMKGPRPYSEAAVTVGHDGGTVSVRGQPRDLREFDWPSSPRAG